MIPKIDAGVDWTVSWLAPFRARGMAIASSSNWRNALNQAATELQLRNHLGHPIEFIQQHELPTGESYEAHISATGKVPTRDNLHDFFNALVWLTFPQIKVRLNSLQAAQIARLGVGKSRGSARDAATLFDENAALLALPDNQGGRAIAQALRTHQWHQLFVAQRQQWVEQSVVFLFGHALMDKLVHPYKAITAHTLICWVDADFSDYSENQQRHLLDQLIASRLDQEELLPGLFSPLPVLGVPAWWPNQDALFYADASVFRPERHKST